MVFNFKETWTNLETQCRLYPRVLFICVYISEITVGSGPQIMYILALVFGPIGLILLVISIVCAVKRCRCGRPRSSKRKSLIDRKSSVSSDGVGFVGSREHTVLSLSEAIDGEIDENENKTKVQRKLAHNGRCQSEVSISKDTVTKDADKNYKSNGSETESKKGDATSKASSAKPTSGRRVTFSQTNLNAKTKEGPAKTLRSLTRENKRRDTRKPTVQTHEISKETVEAEMRNKGGKTARSDEHLPYITSNENKEKTADIQNPLGDQRSNGHLVSINAKSRNAGKPNGPIKNGGLQIQRQERNTYTYDKTANTAKNEGLLLKTLAYMFSTITERKSSRVEAGPISIEDDILPPPKAAESVFVVKKPEFNNKILAETPSYFIPPSKVELLYQVEPPPTSSKPVFRVKRL